MRYVVLGAGAIGGGVGGLLHQAGLGTTLVARGAHLEALQSQGLRLRCGTDTSVVHVPAVGSVADVDWTDDTVLLLGVKSHQTAQALLDLLTVMPVDTPVVSLQNGVSNERLLLRHLPAVHTICVMLPASHLVPGEITLHSGGRPGLLDIGSYPRGVDDVDLAVAADLVTAGFESVPRPDIMAWKHRKLLVNLGNGVDAACRADQAAEDLVTRARQEAEQVLAAAGVEVVGTEADAARRGDLLRPLLGREDAGSSTWQSLRRGTGGTEVDHLNGEIVLLGRLHGVPTPVNELIRRTTSDLAASGGAPRSLDAADLLAQLDTA